MANVKYDIETQNNLVPVQDVQTGRIHLVLPSVARAKVQARTHAVIDREKAEALRQASVIHSD